MPPEPPVEERFAIALDHARLAAHYEIDARGAAIEFRKHLGWYVKGLPGSAELRKKLHAVDVVRRGRGHFRATISRIASATSTARRRRATRRSSRSPRRDPRARARPAAAGRGRHARRSPTRSSGCRIAPVEELGFATIDHHRALRQGFPEVIFGAGKTAEQVVAIAERIAARGDGLLATRLADDAARLARGASRRRAATTLGRTAWLARHEPPRPGTATVLIVTAGTSDLPVAEEAAVTAAAFGKRWSG